MLKQYVTRWGILIFAAILFSCAPTRRAEYLRTYNETDDLNTPDKVYTVTSDSIGAIQPGDELYITVTSGNGDANNFEGAGGAANLGIELLSYKVDPKGQIRIPYLKNYTAAGKTPYQLADSLEIELAQFIYLPTVSIRVVNKQIYVLGEVNVPGVYEFNKPDVNIFELLAHAGDIATFGNRKKVLIVRTVNDSIIKKRVDLTNDQIFQSDWYNMQANDIVYVKRMPRSSVLAFFGAVSTTIATYFLIESIIP